ncbi:hypothetical protein [Croceicoccus marinus]|uniref:Uncharacterized protein n=1 Tax=Croceicoccus marinus TaxID=450378 RepID=A0A7G6W095_9SPHN|nr:hypothetical protein [Croceicoccus marinus]QNE07410.1 hypothetical protein H4O24_16125 [Croceicoccus marinus]
MTRSAAIAMALLVIPVHSASAQDMATGPTADAAVQAPGEMSGPGIFESAAVSEDALQATAGREGISQYSQAELEAAVAHNSVGDNAVTGTAQIDGNAFQNMSGLSILNINTGHNVAINAAMNVNISITPGP